MRGAKLHGDPRPAEVVQVRQLENLYVLAHDATAISTMGHLRIMYRV